MMTPLAEAARLAGVLRRDRPEQYELTRSFVRAQVDAGRWTWWGDHVVLTQNAAPSRRQLMWVALLDAGPPAALASHTALEIAGFTGFAREASRIHVVVPRGARCAPLPGLQVHESRRLDPDDVVLDKGLARTGTARSALDAAAWQASPRFACALVAAVAQQRLCSTLDLADEMGQVGRIRHKAHLRLALEDLAGGSTTTGEADVLRLCRRFRLLPPRRQVRRNDSDGRPRYLDCEWTLSDGQVVVLEVDGRHHLEVGSWQADMRRDRALVVSGRKVLRATNLELRLDPAPLARDLMALGVPRSRPVSVGGRPDGHRG
jgi:hypothetical protein